MSNITFKTSGVEVSENTFESPYISYGINEVRISSVDYLESAQNTPGIRFNFETLEVYPQLDNSPKTTNHVYYLKTEINNKIFIERVILMANALGIRQELDSLGEENLSMKDYVSGLNDIFAGKEARIKFKGKEVAGKEGKNNWFKAELSMDKRFIESIDVPLEQSKLTFDENNKYDVDKLEKLDTNSPVTNETSSSSGLY